MTQDWFLTPEYGIVRASDGSPLLPSGGRFHEPTHGEKATALTRVLVVDDERLIADTVAQILNLHGYDAFSSYSAHEALKLAERYRPDVLLTDVMMPEMNGVDLAQAMEALFPTIKVLLFSGQAGTNALLQSKNIDDSQFRIVAKPIHPEKLVAVVRGLKSRGEAGA